MYFTFGANALGPVLGAGTHIDKRCFTMHLDRPRDGGLEQRAKCPLFGILGLGSADSSTQPDESVDETQKAKISFGQLLKSGQDTTIVLDFADEALD